MARGAAKHRLLAGTAIRPDALESTGLAVEAHDELQVARNLIAQFGDQPGLGIESTTTVSLGGMGLLGLAMISAPTVRHALQLGVRMHRLTFAFSQPSYGMTEAEEYIRLADERIPVDVRGLFVERDIALIARMLPFVVGREGGLRIHARLGSESIAIMQESFAGYSVVQDSVNLLSFESEMLDVPPVQANPQAYRDLVAVVLSEPELRTHADGVITRQVSARIANAPANPPTMARIASDLNMDVRSLRRKLAADNSSYREILDKTRSTLASEILLSHHVTVEEAAAQLGYYDAAGFSAAFKRWFGQSPGHFRSLQPTAQQLPGHFEKRST